MSELEAPPPPGSDTPVPADVVRQPRRRRAVESAPDGLVPQTALEQRAEQRERERRTRALPPPTAAPQQQGWPQPGMQPPWPQPAAQPPASGPPQGSGAPQGYGPVQAYGPPEGYCHPQAYGPPPGYGPAPGYGYPPYGAAHPPGGYGYPSQGYGPPPPVVMPPPPKRRFTRAQTRTALLASLVGQTVLALATHLLLATGIALLLWGLGSEGTSSGLDALDADSLTDVVAFWADPQRVLVTIVILLLVTAAIGAAGWVGNHMWLRKARLPAPSRSIALAYVTTTAIGGIVGSMVWPVVVVAGFFTAALTGPFVSGMWTIAFSTLGVSVLLTGAVGMLFGWVYLLAARPRPTWAQIEAEQRQAEVDAEHRAAAADAAELSRVD